MSEEQLDALIDRWEQLQAEGKAPASAEICRECPELLSEFERRIARLRDFNEAFGLHEELPSDVEIGEFCDGRFEIRQVHGQGGQGTVFIAFDRELQRTVAVKTPGRSATNGEVRRRFESEATMTGRLEHPGIIPVYGYGHDANGIPGYAMKFVRGRTLSEAIREHHATGDSGVGDALSLRKLVRQFLTVCETLAFAHSRGIVHRDLKPANIMLGEFGEVLVADWGLAKQLPVDVAVSDRATTTVDAALEETVIPDPLQSQRGVIKGTLAYMSPEQAAGDDDRVGPISDVYGLGATLYALLTGRPPMTGNSTMELLQNVVAGKIDAPRAVNDRVPPALDAVCRHALATRPEDRYASARALAEDVERWLAEEPVTAYVEPWTMRAERWVKRHRPLVSATAAALLVAVATLSVAALLLTDKQRELQSAYDELGQQYKSLRESDYTNEFLLAAAAWRERDVEQSDRVLDECAPELRNIEWFALKRLARPPRTLLQETYQSLDRVAVSADGTRLAAVGWLRGTPYNDAESHAVSLVDLTTGHVDHTLTCGNDALGLCFSPHGDWLAVASRRTGVSQRRSQESVVRVWNVDSGTLAWTSTPAVQAYQDVAFNADGSEVIAVTSSVVPQGVEPHPGAAYVWETPTSTLRDTIEITGVDSDSRASLSQDGQLTLWHGLSADSNTVQLVETGSGKLCWQESNHRDRVTQAVFSTSGDHIVLVDAGGQVDVRDQTTGALEVSRLGLDAGVDAVALSSDGNLLAVVGSDRQLKIMNLKTGTTERLLPHRHGEAHDVAFLPDGRQVVTVGDDGAARLWDVEQATYRRLTSDATIVAAALAGGDLLVTTQLNGELVVWDIATGQSRFRRSLTGGGGAPTLPALAVSPAGDRIAVSTDTGVLILDAATGNEINTLTQLQGPLAFVYDGQQLMARTRQSLISSSTGSHRRDGILHQLAPEKQTTSSPLSRSEYVVEVNVANGQIIHRLDSDAEHMLQQAGLLATGRDRQLTLWQLGTTDDAPPEVLQAIETTQRRGIRPLAFRRDGGQLVAGGSDDLGARVWNTSTWIPIFLNGHSEPVTSATFSANGSRIATGSRDRTVRLWNAATGQHLWTLTGAEHPIHCVLITPDNHTVIAAGGQGTTTGEIILWDVAPIGTP